MYILQLNHSENFDHGQVEWWTHLNPEDIYTAWWPYYTAFYFLHANSKFNICFFIVLMSGVVDVGDFRKTKYLNYLQNLRDLIFKKICKEIWF